MIYITVNMINFPLFEPVKIQLQDKIGKNWIEILVGHVFLVNPWASGWANNFISSAWWFIPPLLVAYIAFPIYFKVLTKFGGKFLLSITLLISVGSYYLSKNLGLNENHWHYIILFESFNFALGIFLGHYYTNYQDKQHLQKILFRPISLILGLVLVVAGNMMNWFSYLYPWSSLLFTFGLFVLGSNLANFMLRVPFVKRLKNCDSYIFYLIHQLIAYFFALCLNYVLRGYTPFFGGIIYILTVIFAASFFVKFYDGTTKFISSRLRPKVN